jgi:hypothetical protein
MPIRADLLHFYRTPQWKAARAACCERASDRCEDCGEKNGNTVFRIKGKRRVLIQCGCSHKNNVAGDDRPKNLAWLCRGCHLRRDQLFHHETRAARKDQARPLLNAAMEASS